VNVIVEVLGYSKQTSFVINDTAVNGAEERVPDRSVSKLSCRATYDDGNAEPNV
jgi:hypothetical protein